MERLLTVIWHERDRSRIREIQKSVGAIPGVSVNYRSNILESQAPKLREYQRQGILSIYIEDQNKELKRYEKHL